MSKKEKRLVAVSSIYFIGLITIMIASLVLGLIRVKGFELLILAFILYLIVGYVVIAIMRMNTFIYKCPKCKNAQKMTFTETLFSRRGDNSRILTCRKCNTFQNMERMPK